VTGWELYIDCFVLVSHTKSSRCANRERDNGCTM
jgi:hypothetical protein